MVTASIYRIMTHKALSSPKTDNQNKVVAEPENRKGAQSIRNPL